MQQLSLVEKPKEVEQPKQVKKLAKTLVNNDAMWSKVNAWIENCKKQRENFAHFTVEYWANIYVDGSKDEHISTSTAMERPFKKEGDSYGGCWGCGGSYDKNELDKLKETLIKWRNDYLEVPYCKENADGTALRDVKAENIRIFIDDNAKNFINRTAKWSLNQLAEELKAIKEKPLTEEYLKRFERMKFLDKEIRRIEYEIIPELKKKVESFFQNSLQSALEKPDLNQIAEIMNKNKCDLKQMQKEYDGLRHELYRW